jgi:hypothetical protein
MTIGIAAVGPGAGMAVFDALGAVERVGWGAIGGFVTFVALTGRGELLRFETQRGGTATLFIDGEKTGVVPPKIVADAVMAALMSSGPDRPEPLSQFVAAASGAGIVTGHRLPNAPGVSGIPVNEAALSLMRSGKSARQAVKSVLAENPKADAGLIAIDAGGAIFSANSERVQDRPDLGHARAATGGSVVEVLHNAIHPIGSIAQLAADIALEAMIPTTKSDGWVNVTIETPLSFGPEDCVIIGENGNALEIITTDERILKGRWNCAAIYLGSMVKRDGRVLGQTVFEPNVVVADGRILSMSGQESLRLGYRRVEPDK